MWPESYDQSMLSTSGHHVDDKPLTRDHRVEGEKSRVKFPCRFCGGIHCNHICPRMDEASHLLEEITLIQQKLPTSYRRFSPNPSLVDEVVDPNPSLVDPTLPIKSDLPSVDEVVNPVMLSVNPVPQESSLLLQDSVVAHEQPLVSCQESILEQPLVNKVVETNLSSIDPTLAIESDSNIADVFLVSSDCSGQGAIPSHTTVPPLSSEVCSFNWNSLAEPSLPSDVPFQILIKVAGKDIFRTIVDEGASVSILSSTAWQAIGSPQLVPATEKILALN